MIEILCGRGGSGKSYIACTRIAQALRMGRRVYHNLPLYSEKWPPFIALKFGVEIEPESLCEIPDAADFLKTISAGTTEFPVVVVLDEAHFSFNARDWASSPRKIMEFLTVARHYNVDLLWITQHADNLDKQIRRLAHHIHYVRCLYTNPIAGMKLKGWRYLITRDFDSTIVSNKRLLFHKKDIYSLYDSYNSVGTIEIGHVDPPKIKKLKKSKPHMKYILSILLVAGCFGAFKIISMFVGGKDAIRKSQPIVEKSTHLKPSEKIEPIKKDEPLYIVEKYKGFFEGILLTETDIYIAGQPSNHGKVLRVMSTAAVCQFPSGQITFVYATQNYAPTSANARFDPQIFSKVSRK